MKDTSGYYVQYKKKDGTLQKAIMRHKEQTDNYKNYNRALLRLVNNDLTEATDEHGKKLIAVVYLSELTRIGFVD